MRLPANLALLMLVGIFGAALGGCASQFSMRSVPSETPAAVNASAVRAAEAMEAAAKQAAAGQKPTPPNQQPTTPGAAPATSPTAEGAGPAQPSPHEEGAALERQAGAPTPGAAPAPSPTTGTAPSPAPGAAPSSVAEGTLPTQPTQTGPATTTATAGAPAENKPDAEEPLVPLTDEDVPSMYTYDPWDRINRFTYRFNARFDEAIFLPVTNGYRRVPGPIRLGVHNFFSNLTEIDSFANYILQARFGGSAKSLGRFVINSTIGIGGLFDVAKHMKLPSAPTGFSETLSTWGSHPGPYLVMPILGPSTLRDGVGYLGDYALDYGVNPFNIYRGNASYGLGTLNAIDTRSNVGFRYYATGSPFEYEVIRFLYVRKRLIEDDALHGRGKPKPRDAGAPAGR
jgi:phospholipid-binding lipoprotein MlaA